ncbi:cell division ATP-binding protein FtsE [Candidatus Epulonipiscium viviparus]|uniref:cell division ATP-binding protein FtsE n=1 Tax=Candidatus Epulonipiscium viviparus TaxID=420336 RepID=UPI00016C070A|nr:cell division ATP-binding protein FtsE [Candidatus Epulopiscium viviparus]
MIELAQVSKIYSNGAIGLKTTSLHIKKGEFVFVTGNSGSGKSSFLKLILKEIEPSTGIITVNGRNIENLIHRQIPYYRRQIGVVFQDFRLLYNKTVFDNVAFAMRVIGAKKKHIKYQVPMALALVGLSKKANCYPNELSGGEQQRTAIARAIVNNNPILIADEPTGNLDPSTAWDIMKLLLDINSRGVTVLVASHESDIVTTFKKRVLELQNGEIISDQNNGGYGQEEEYV